MADALQNKYFKALDHIMGYKQVYVEPADRYNHQGSVE